MEFADNVPIYQQVIRMIESKVIAGELKPGEKFTAVRTLALELNTNPNTVQRALSELERTGLLRTERGNGRFVTDDGTVIDILTKRLIQEQVADFIQTMAEFGLQPDEITALVQAQLTNEEK
jgi:GntR family transcriptional regulator